MKGLIFRELYLTRKARMTTIFVATGFGLLGILLRLSVLYGNLAGSEIAAESDFFTLKTIFTYCTGALFAMSLSQSGQAASDSTRGWIKYIRSTPLSAYKFIGAKMVILIIGWIACCGIGLGYMGILLNLYDVPVGGAEIKGFMIIMCLMLISLTFELTVSIAFRKSTLIIAAAAMSIYIPFMCAVMNYINSFASRYPELSEEERNILMQTEVFAILARVRDIFIPLLPFVVIVMLVLCFVLCSAAIMRREK